MKQLQTGCINILIQDQAHRRQNRPNQTGIEPGRPVFDRVTQWANFVAKIGQIGGIGLQSAEFLSKSGRFSRREL